MTLSPGSSSVRIGIHRWTIDTIFRGPAAGQRSVVLSTGLRAGFRSPKSTIATGRYRRSSRPSRPRLDTVPQDRHTAIAAASSSAQAPARNIERERGRIGDIQTFYLARHIDARQTIAGCFRQLP